MTTTKATNQSRSSIGSQVITASTTVTLTSLTRSVYVGTAGHLRVTLGDGVAVTLTNVTNGYHPLEVEVFHRSTTAADIVALF